ncbi:Cloroperoxidase [Marasmius fiardii PR-910]|nr:Cloroperoxidase [Marasmius fiardii PR-910]
MFPSPLLLLLSCFAALSLAQPVARDPHDQVDWSQHAYQRPTTGDVRGPCPGLNTLANHGFLPRDGRNITIPVLLQAAAEGFNIHPEIMLVPVKMALFSTFETDHFSLDELSLPGVIEHDASISRHDSALGNNKDFDEELYQTLATSNPGVDYYNVTSAAQVMKARLDHSLANNPKVTNTIKEFQTRAGEASLYLSTMGDPATGRAPKKFVDILFREERMPLEEGWKISSVQITRTLTTPLIGAVMQGSGWAPSEGQYPWTRLSPASPQNPIEAGTIL